MAYKISDKLNRELTELIELYPHKEAVLLPALNAVQKEAGWISEEAMEALSVHLQLPYSRIKGVVTFYTMFNRMPPGQFHLQVCRNISCHFSGAPDILRRLKTTLGINEGETTPDGIFTLSTTECLGSCGTAPVVSVNGTYHEKMTPEKTDLLLRDLAAKSAKPGKI